jgi:PilZ domain
LSFSTRKSSTRRFARYRTEMPLIVRVLGQDGYIRIHGRCFEIAENGLGAVVTSEFAAGEMVSLEFSIPGSEEVMVLRGVVRHRMGFLHGFEFVSLLPDQAEQIRAYCRTLQPA